MTLGESAWTGERTARLRRMWEGGISAGLIARELGATTRSAVIAKAHRLNLAARTTHNATVTIRQARKGRARPVQPVQTVPTVRTVTPPDLGLACTLLELRPHHCRFVLGQPRGLNTLYCANPVTADSSYCPAHHALTHQPARAQP